MARERVSDRDCRTTVTYRAVALRSVARAHLSTAALMPAEPHIRSPFPERLAPQSLILKVIGLGRAGPHCMSAYHSHCLRRSARPDPTGLIRPAVELAIMIPVFPNASAGLHDSTCRDLTMADVSREDCGRARRSKCGGSGRARSQRAGILPPVGVISKHSARLRGPGRQANRAQPHGEPRFSTFESGCGRETDSPLEGGGFEPSVPREGNYAHETSP